MIHDKCGLCGVWGHREASNFTYLGLHAQQHRGQESAGIVATDGQMLHTHLGMGLVEHVFEDEQLLRSRLTGHTAIGHVRYSTAGSSTIENAQPFVVYYRRGPLAVAHNGNLTNAAAIKQRLEDEGSIFRSTMDTEVITHLIARSHGRHLTDRIIEALNQVEGAYSLLFLSQQHLIAARDPHGFRPLVMGVIERPDWDETVHVFASETCAFDLIGARLVREIEPGEIVVVTAHGAHSQRFAPARRRSACIFELIYFSRPDSSVFGQNVYRARKAMGARLAEEHPVEADLVTAVPDSGLPAAMGYAARSGIPFELGLIRNHYVGRTFIEPSQSIRNFGVKLKLNPQRHLIEGRRVVVVDDSIVRGTTSRKLIKMIRNAGAREIHLRISSPPITHSCFYGIDTPSRDQLIAAQSSVEEIRDYLGVETLGYLSIAGLRSVAGERADGFCYACFSGSYPVPIGEEQLSEQIAFAGKR